MEIISEKSGQSCDIIMKATHLKHILLYTVQYFQKSIIKSSFF